MLDFDYTGDSSLRAVANEVNASPENQEAWRRLLDAVVKQDGLINRGSDPAEIAGTRAAFDQYLTLYPLSQGTWLEYAALEFRLGGAEAAEYVYERAVGSCASSVDVWMEYYKHRMATTHDTRAIRELLQRAVDTAGHDFNAEQIWDAHLLHEQKAVDAAELLETYKTLITIPLFHYARYYNEFRTLVAQLPVEAIEGGEVLEEIYAQVHQAIPETDEAGLVAAVRTKVDALHWENFQKMQEEVNRLWEWEQHLGKDGGAKLDEASRLRVWTEYLDYQENKGNYAASQALYERCLLYNSTQLDLWYRYVRWLIGQPEKDEEARNVYRRACYLFAPKYDSSFRLSWAKFEEAYSRSAVSADVYEAVLEELPDDMPTHLALTMLYRREHGLVGAVQSLATRLNREDIQIDTKGALIGEWARLVWRETGDVKRAREVFTQYQSHLTDVASFWSGWLSFEIDQPRRPGEPDRTRMIYQTMQQMANLPAPALQELSVLYMRYLDERADTSSIAEMVELDALMNGPASLRSSATAAQPATNGDEHGGDASRAQA